MSDSAILSIVVLWDIAWALLHAAFAGVAISEGLRVLGVGSWQRRAGYLRVAAFACFMTALSAAAESNWLMTTAAMLMFTGAVRSLDVRALTPRRPASVSTQ